MGAAPEGGSPWLQLVPFALVLGDLLLHHPAADEAEAAEGAGVPRQPEGRRPGHHDRRHLRADHATGRADACSCRSPTRCAIEVARAAIGGYQGQEPVVEPHAISRHSVMTTCAGSSSPSSPSSSSSSAVGVYPIVAARYGITSPSWLMDKQLKLGLDLKGGVHLVLRVQTDDALRLETEQEMERLREELTTRGIAVTNLDARRRRRTFSVEGVPPDAGRGVPAGGRRGAARTSTASSGVNGTYTFTMKPNIAGAACARKRSCRRAQTIERRVNELGVTEPSIAQQGANGDQILVQLPGVTDVERAKEIIRSTGPARAEDRRAGAGGDARRRCSSTARCRRAWRSCRARARRRATGATGLLPGAQGGGGDRPRPAQRARRRSTRTTSRR